MALARVQSQIGRNIGAGLAVSFSATPTAGNLIVVHASSDADITSVVDNQSGNTYTNSQYTANGSTHQAIYRMANANAAGTFTITVTGGVAKTVVIVEYSGAATASEADGVNGTTGTSTSASTGNVTTTNADDVLTAGLGSNTGANEAITEDSGAGWSLIREEQDGSSWFAAAAADRIVASTGTYSHTWTLASSVGWETALAAYEAAGGAAQDTPELRGRPHGLRGHNQMRQLLAQ